MKLLAGLLLAGGTRAEENECRPANQKICENISTIPNESDAVCGSDGITYSNQCLFKHYKCITGVVVNKQHQGPCQDERNSMKDLMDVFQHKGPIQKIHCPVKCHKQHGSEVCGDDNNTYRNECEIMKLQCEGKDIFFSHFGACCNEGEVCNSYEGEGIVMQHDMVGGIEPEIDPRSSFMESRPPQVQAFAELIRKKTDCLRGCTQQSLFVCGSDGTTYPNECVLREKACAQEKNGKGNVVSKVSHGMCSNLVQNDSVDEWVEDNPDHVAISHWGEEDLQMRSRDYESYDAPPGYVAGSSGSADSDLRQGLIDNAFYFQPSMTSDAFFGEMGIDANFEMDVGLNEQIDTFNLIEVEEEEEEEEEESEELSDVLEQFEQLQEEEEKFVILEECEDAYPKVVDGKFVKCPQDKGLYDPVCGTDDVTYFNDCVFTSEKCFGGDNNLEIKHRGMCHSDPLAKYHEEEEPIILTQRSQDKPVKNLTAKQLKQKARLAKRVAYRQSRKQNAVAAQPEPVSAYARTMRGQNEHLDLFKEKKPHNPLAGKTPEERQAIRYQTRLNVRVMRREKLHNKEVKAFEDMQATALANGMQLDVGVPLPAEFDEEAETIKAEEETAGNKFPQLCSKIDCDDFAKATNDVQMCGKIKNSENQTLEGEILEFRNRCMFKKKRCHLRKKAQQLFNTKTRKIRKQRSTDESELEVLKFNRIGERLKKVNCQTGLPKNKN